MPPEARAKLAAQLVAIVAQHSSNREQVRLVLTDEVARDVVDDLIDQPYCLQCGGCGYADCCMPCPYVKQYQGSYDEVSAQLGRICNIVDELFDHIQKKYDCVAPQGLTCPIHQRLWHAVHSVTLPETERETEMRALLDRIAGSDMTGGAPTYVVEAQDLMRRYRIEDRERTDTKLEPNDQNPEGPQG